jgi:hypothetical protein
LLCRAEAKAQLNDLSGAVNDLRLWAQSYNVQGAMDTLANGDVNLTLAKIKSFYAPGANVNWVPVLHNTDICPSWTLSADQEAVIDCVLHFRRLESIHTGLRWHDLKRYGIEITHRQDSNPTQKLLWNDDRRAIQLPQEVILAGMAANPRVIVGDHVGSENAGGIYVPTQPMVTTAVEASTLGAQLTRENND